MGLDIFTDFLINNTAMQNVLMAILIGTFIIALLIIGGIKKPEVIILSVCLVFIYLYYLELISIIIFGIVLLILAIVLYFTLQTNRNV